MLESEAPEITIEQARVLLAQQRFLIHFRDTLRALTDPVAIHGEACRLLGEYLSVDRATYAEVDEKAGIARVASDWTRDGVPTLASAYRLTTVSWFVEIMRRGDCAVVSNTQTSALIPAGDRSALEALGITACMGAPLVAHGQLVGALCVAASSPRVWTEGDVALLREVGERLGEAIQRAHAEQALRVSEEKYRTLFNATDEGVCTIEVLFDDAGQPVDYRFLDMNPAFVRQTGLEGAIGRTMRSLAPEHEAFWFEVYGHIATTGEARRFEHIAAALGRFYDVFAFRVGHPDERRVAVIFNDVSQRKRAEDALIQSEARLRALIEHLPRSAVFVVDHDLRYLLAQGEALTLAGYAPQDLVGRTVAQAMPPGVIAEYEEHYRRALVGEAFEYEHASHGRVFITRGTPLRGAAGAIDGVLVVSYDITERKQAEAMIQNLNRTLEERTEQRTRELLDERAALQVANEELEAFNYSVSHDLMTPVRHVEGFASMAARHLDDPVKARRSLEVVSQAAKRMETLINAMLILSRTGRRELTMGVVDLGALAGQARLDVLPRVDGRAVEWHFGSLPLVQGDRVTLQQVMTNLLDNAVKFSRDRAPAVIEVWAEDGGQEWTVHVRDNGAGFDARFAEKLFGIFQRLHHQDEFEGTGVGLSLVRRIIARHGGTVRITGAIDQGATFSFTLPKPPAAPLRS
ncbi:PAS domain S-box-containing protein [Deinococcus metalli]|uniref:histidine kinase n=1 Tax=Deinococcus metalli TaxID=1141878 RepID=A0A7W8NN58_9DEIO|nr:ATP-binding protein [Deinococcus metalli]MBB5376534.1 PAS domain S-box-containing protein [Deinococcus metalli]GHF43299.1 hypothetical protein GCM10017781_19670 [Deinococcus metalli]